MRTSRRPPGTPTSFGNWFSIDARRVSRGFRSLGRVCSDVEAANRLDAAASPAVPSRCPQGGHQPEKVQGGALSIFQECFAWQAIVIEHFSWTRDR